MTDSPIPETIYPVDVHVRDCGHVDLTWDDNVLHVEAVDDEALSRLRRGIVVSRDLTAGVMIGVSLRYDPWSAAAAMERVRGLGAWPVPGLYVELYEQRPARRPKAQEMHLKLKVDQTELEPVLAEMREARDMLNAFRARGAQALGENGAIVYQTFRVSDLASELRDAAPEDVVNHPKHYTTTDPAYEPIRVIEEWALGFNLGNVVKYIARAGKKPGSDRATDLKKAAWYLEREVMNAAAEGHA